MRTATAKRARTRARAALATTAPAPVSAPVTATAGEATVSLGRLSGFVGFRLRRIQNHLSRRFQERIARYELPSGTLNALGIIEANPGISQIDVARQIGQDTSAAGLLVEELETRGWIRRERLRQNRRRYSIRITDSGRKLLDELLVHLAEVENKLLTTLSSHELLLLSRVLDRIYADCFTGP